MEHVHQRLLDRLRDIREESMTTSSERSRVVNAEQAVRPAPTAPVPITIPSVPQQMVRNPSRGLPPTNAGPTLQQPVPVIVRSTPASAAFTVRPDPAPTDHPTNESTTALTAQTADLYIRYTSPTPFSTAEQARIRSEFPPETNIAFETVPPASTTQQHRLTPDETLHIAFTDPPPWHRSNARTHNRDRDPSLTYRGMTVAARLGESTSNTSTATASSADTDESSFLSSFPFLRELYESPPPDPVSPRTQPRQLEGSDGMLNFAQMMADSNRRTTIMEAGTAVLEQAMSRARPLPDRGGVTHETEVQRRLQAQEQRRAARERARQEYDHTQASARRREEADQLVEYHPDRQGGNATASPMDLEVRRIQRAEAHRIRTLARDIVSSRPERPVDVDIPLAARQLEARVSIERSRARIRELAGMRREVGEVRAEAAVAGFGEEEITVTVGPADRPEESRRVSEAETVFEGAGERREGASASGPTREGAVSAGELQEGAIGEPAETTGEFAMKAILAYRVDDIARPASSGDATYSEHKGPNNFDAHLWPVPVRPRYRERVYISMMDL